MRDIRDAWRGLRAAGSSTAVALILLTVGIGAGTAVFSVVDAVLRSLPFPEADRLVVISGRNVRNGVLLRATPQDYVDWKTQQDVFEAMAAVASGPDLVIEDPGGAQSVVRTRVTADLFRVLGVQPAMGRAFTSNHEVQGHHLVAVLSDAFWKRRFGGDPAVIGKTLTFEAGTYEIVGVMPARFEWPLGAARPTEIYTPYVVPASQRVRGSSKSFALQVLGRLKPGASLANARARMEQIHRGLADQFPDWFQNRDLAVAGLRASLTGEAGAWMWLLTGAVGFLLLLVCVNVSGLALARGLSRARETAVRAALGASRWQIARVIVLESLLLACAGAAAGAALAYAAVGILRAAVPASLPRVAEIAVDSRVLAGAALAALVTGIACSVLPALRFSRADIARALQVGIHHGTSGSPVGSIGTYLVIGEITLSLVLLVGAGLFIGSFSRLMAIDLGLDYRNVLTVPAHVRFASFAQRAQAADRAAVMLPAVIERVKAIPGVESAAAIAGGVPLSGGSIRSTMHVRGRATQLLEDVVDIHQVTAEYFQALRIPLLKGRLLSATDRRDASRVVVLSESAAKKYFPEGDPLGAMVWVEPEKDMMVVGIVRDLRLDGPERPPRPEAYIPLSQDIVTGADLVVRTTGDPLSMAAAVKSAIWSVEPGAVIPDAVTLETRLERIIAPRKFNMLVFMVLGVVAIAVAATGIYGLLAQQVEQRRGEIGIRIALGAEAGTIVALVLGRAFVCLAAGLAAGLAGAWYLARFVELFLFQTTPHAAPVYVVAGAFLLTVGAAASLIPAMRATRVDPLITLKAG